MIVVDLERRRGGEANEVIGNRNKVSKAVFSDCLVGKRPPMAVVRARGNAGFLWVRVGEFSPPLEGDGGRICSGCENQSGGLDAGTLPGPSCPERHREERF